MAAVSCWRCTRRCSRPPWPSWSTSVRARCRDGAEPIVYVPDAIADVRRRWRLEAAWKLDDGTTGGDGLEVLDTADGLWMLTTGDEGGQPIAWPVTATLVWRHIVRIVMRRAADA